MPSNRRHWHCWVKRGEGLFKASVPLTRREIENDLPAGSKRRVRRWFTSRAAARKRGLREGADATFMVIECNDPRCKDAPLL